MLKPAQIDSGFKSWVKSKKNYIKAYIKGIQLNKDFAEVETYCMFIGYPRSGHSLVGSLLDAHPDIVIAHELDALKYLQDGYTRRQLFYLLLKKSQDFTATGRIGAGYSYTVPNQWNGRFRRLKVIGDKRGGRSSRRLGENPELLHQLKQVIGINPKLIHVMRNPFDNITTISFRGRMDLEEAIIRYFTYCAYVMKVKGLVNEKNWFEFKHESFVAHPKLLLTKILEFLGQPPSKKYLCDCASIILKAPHKSRMEGLWTRDLIHRVQNEIAKISLSSWIYLCELNE